MYEAVISTLKDCASSSFVDSIVTSYTKLKFPAKEDIDIDKLGRFTSALALKLCPGGIDRCECANKNETFTQGPFDFDKDPIGVSLMQLTCNPDFCYCKVRSCRIS